ncbi:MAG TPA: KEOPS complex subunit Pcc1 [Candidatus Bathyarchaeia archaeon]|jgi:tRNA threonylcarbamoyladenosine modification (KEOPS) complex  Pcc1 subunit|nr:KEOPS complex subunit Pcc1 [Candidatus Bathyarchaeia archaeon]
MKTNASIRFRFPSEKQLNIILEALTPETKASTIRSRATLKKEGGFLVLRVEAKDTVALRAALNAYLRWINSIFNVLKVLERT